MSATRFPLLPTLLVLGAGLFAYHGTWNNAYVFDDLPAIDENVQLAAKDWWGAAFSTKHHPLANRPVSCLSIALDFLVFGEGPFGPHLTNLVLHLVNALLVAVTLRRALLAPNLGGRFTTTAATHVATVVAMLWVAHPLGADAVAYATQRSTLLISMFLSIALLATLRAPGSARPWAWRAVAVVAVTLGMASKEDMVAAPILVLLFQRAFVAPTWRALRPDRRWFAALASTWLVLGACVWFGPSNPTVGVNDTPYTSWQWLQTQAGVVVHYLRLVVVPWPLRGAYDDGPATFASAVLPGLVVVALLVTAVRCWWSRPWLGWLGALFFLLLAPTSTVLPIETEVVAERRMYLPMLAVLIPLVLTGHRFVAMRTRTWRIGGAAVVAAAAIGLGLLTRDRVWTYADPTRFWADAFAKREPGRRTFLAAQILANHGAMLWQQRRFDEAHVCYSEAMQCPNPTAVECMQYAVSLFQRGDQQQALAMLRDVLRQAPDNGDVQGSLGTCLLAMHYEAKEPRGNPALVEAETVLRRAVVLKPKNAAYWNSLGYVLRERGNLPEAEQAYEQACALTKDRVEPFLYRADVLTRLGREAEVKPMFEQLLRDRPTDAQLRIRLAEIDAASRDFVSARRRLDEALRLEPGNAAASELLRRIQGAR